MSTLNIIIGNKYYSSWSLRGWLAVKHTGLKFTETLLPLDTPEFHKRIKDLSPTGYVPCLHDGDIRVWDSLAIIDYCAMLAPEKYWWPKEKPALALARSMCAEMHSGFAALRKAAPMNMNKSYTGHTLSDSVTRDVKRIDTLWQQAHHQFSGHQFSGSDKPGDYLFGDFSAADMMFAPIVSRFLTYDIEVSGISRAYMARIDSHPYINAWRLEAAKEAMIIKDSEIDPSKRMLG